MSRHRSLGGRPSSRKRGSSSAPPTEPTLLGRSSFTPSPLWHVCCCGVFPSSSKGPLSDTCGRCGESCWQRQPQPLIVQVGLNGFLALGCPVTTQRRRPAP